MEEMNKLLAKRWVSGPPPSLLARGLLLFSIKAALAWPQGPLSPGLSRGGVCDSSSPSQGVSPRRRAQRSPLASQASLISV